MERETKQRQQLKDAQGASHFKNTVRSRQTELGQQRKEYADKITGIEIDSNFEKATGG